MSIDIQRLYSDYKIDWINSGPQTTKNWINTQCPFCSDTKYHLGYNEKLNIFSCWRCGLKNSNHVLSKVLNVSYKQVETILTHYYTAPIQEVVKHTNRIDSLVLPRKSQELSFLHKKYLKYRKFNWEEIEKLWRIEGTKNEGRYKNRIIIPIYYKNKLVSYHSRDVLGTSKIKAKACPLEKEVIHHKNLLYGFDNVIGNSVIVTEGPFDAWRMGFGSVATFGTKFTKVQESLLTCFKNVFIMFDDGIDAQKQAQKLADKLSIFCDVFILDNYDAEDPAALNQNEADKIKNEIRKVIK